MVPKLTHEQLVDAFGTKDVWRFEEAALPGGLTEPATRGFLTEVGFPLELRTGFVMAEELLHDADPTPFPQGIEEPWPDDFAGPWTVAFFDIAQGTWS